MTEAQFELLVDAKAASVKQVEEPEATEESEEVEAVETPEITEETVEGDSEDDPALATTESSEDDSVQETRADLKKYLSGLFNQK